MKNTISEEITGTLTVKDLDLNWCVTIEAWQEIDPYMTGDSWYKVWEIDSNLESIYIGDFEVSEIINDFYLDKIIEQAEQKFKEGVM